jgi:hypothetical protein
MQLGSGEVRVVPNGISLEGFPSRRCLALRRPL